MIFGCAYRNRPFQLDIPFWVVQHAGYPAVYWGAAAMWFGLCCYFFVSKPFAKQ
ncbi:hypothetical protein [Paenibacillus sp. A3]|uniref:hypothetical protein n=1 Tax=Paenibacillus sp. A3 TaxID=1337054 RepID=UPI000A86E678|nr:hypothetical protein [Paenibacillus sp. A3]